MRIFKDVHAIEQAPARVANFNRHGGGVGFRSSLFGAFIEFRWNYVPGLTASVGFDASLQPVSFVNGPRAIITQLVFGIHRLRFGPAITLFFGRRIASVESALESSRQRFSEVIRQKIEEERSARLVEAAKPEVSSPDSSPIRLNPVPGETGVDIT